MLTKIRGVSLFCLKGFRRNRSPGGKPIFRREFMSKMKIELNCVLWNGFFMICYCQKSYFPLIFFFPFFFAFDFLPHFQTLWFLGQKGRGGGKLNHIQAWFLSTPLISTYADIHFPSGDLVSSFFFWFCHFRFLIPTKRHIFEIHSRKGENRIIVSGEWQWSRD